MNLIRGWLFDNIGLKLTALLLAVLVYLNVYTDRTASMLISFPIEYADLADSLTLSGGAPALAQATLRGTGKQLIALQLREPRLKVSLLGVGSGPFRQTLAPSDLPLPAGGGVTVENLMGPRILELTIDRKAKRDVRVAIHLDGRPADGYAWDGVARLDPPVLHVTGPLKVLATLDSLLLTPIRIDGKRDTLRVDIAPASVPDWCTIDPAVVHVKLALLRKAN